MLQTVFGENADSVPAQALHAGLMAAGVDGDLYLGYPILSTADGKIFVDALLISQKHGFVAFDLASKIDMPRPDADTLSIIGEKQDQIFASLYNKLNNHASLRAGRSLAIQVNVVTFHTMLAESVVQDDLVLTPPKDLAEVLGRFSSISSELIRPLNAAIQRVSTLRPVNKRENVSKSGSRGWVLKKIEREIANLDNWQNRGAIEYTNGPQRIRGLAGSGKTVVLALKASYLHARHPEWKIAVTFSSRSLYHQFKDLIRRFTYDQTEEDPNWDNLLVMHAWGSTRDAGVYSTACAAYGVAPLDWKTADARYGSRSLEGACDELNKVINQDGPKAVFDAVLVDEAQDLPTSFYRMLYNVVDEPHRIIWAYDDLQNLGDYEMRSAEELFGSSTSGEALVRLENREGRPQEDIVLPVCYRNTPWALATAHALGFGIYRKQGLVQMFDQASIWPRIGYESIGGQLELGQPARLRRKTESSPRYFAELLDPNDAVVSSVFTDEIAQYEELARLISTNVTVDELDHSDILIVLPNTYTSKSVGGRIMRALAEANISSHLVGVTSSREEIFKKGSVAITHIHRAKGNEAAMVYIVNAHYCHDGFELSRKRNILFTAVTRSRSWVRIFGVGQAMAELKAEIESARAQGFELAFRYPTQAEIDRLSRVHRDMPENEQKEWLGRFTAFEDVLIAVENGEVPMEALPRGLRERIAGMATSWKE